MVLSLLIGGGLALLAGAGANEVHRRVFKKVDNIRHGAKGFGDKAAAAVNDIRRDTFDTINGVAHTVDHVAHNVTENISLFNRGCLAAIEMLSRRIDVSVYLLTNAIVDFIIALSLALLLYLTQSSLFLHTTVGFLFVFLCFQMICNHLMQPNSVGPLQQHVPSVQPTLDKKKLIKG